MRLFVTGGTGFLGNAIVKELCAQGHTVLSFSRAKTNSFIHRSVEHFQGDVCEYIKLKSAMSGCEAVFHVAAKIGMWGKYEDFYKTNVTGTEHVLKACRELNIRNLIFTSSASVVFDGNSSEGKDESLPYPKKYLAAYPQTKALAEQLVLAANDVSLKTVSLRPHLIWGPHDCHYLPRLIKKAKAGKLRIVGHAANHVDCIYIDNAVKAHLKVFSQLVSNPTAVEGKAYFISQGSSIPIAELINKLLATADLVPITKRISTSSLFIAAFILETSYRLLGIKAEPPITRFLAHQLSTSHWFDITAAKRDFGYEVSVSLEEGMESIRKWVSENKKQFY